MIAVECCGIIAADLCKLLKKLAGTTGLEPAASAVTGQRSNQLNYVPSFVGKLQIQTLSVGQTVPDNLNSLTDNSAGRHSRCGLLSKLVRNVLIANSFP